MIDYKRYLGDAVYANYDELRGMVLLTTEDGPGEGELAITNRIWLEPEVYDQLEHYVQWLEGQLRAEQTRADVAQKLHARLDPILRPEGGD